MEEKKTIFDYLGQAMISFGVMMVMMNVFCLLFGEAAQEISTLFRLGGRGLAVETVVQFLAVAFFVAGSRVLFFTDLVFKRMSILLRTVCMLLTIVAIVIAFSLVFGWFPVNMWQPWVMFFLSLTVSFLVSAGIMFLKEKTENRRMEEALQKLRQREESEK